VRAQGAPRRTRGSPHRRKTAHSSGGKTFAAEAPSSTQCGVGATPAPSLRRNWFSYSSSTCCCGKKKGKYNRRHGYSKGRGGCTWFNAGVASFSVCLSTSFVLRGSFLPSTATSTCFAWSRLAMLASALSSSCAWVSCTETAGRTVTGLAGSADEEAAPDIAKEGSEAACRCCRKFCFTSSRALLSS